MVVWRQGVLLLQTHAMQRQNVPCDKWEIHRCVTTSCIWIFLWVELLTPLCGRLSNSDLFEFIQLCLFSLWSCSVFLCLCVRFSFSLLFPYETLVSLVNSPGEAFYVFFIVNITVALRKFVFQGSLQFQFYGHNYCIIALRLLFGFANFPYSIRCQ